MPTMKDVARRAGVSTATVSNVLTGTRHVSLELQQAVLRAVDETGYLPNAVARSLRVQRAMIVGLLVPDITNPFFSGLADAIQAAADASDYQVILSSSSEDDARERQRVLALAARQVDGLIIVPARDEMPHLEVVRERVPATVLLDRGPATAPFPSVGVDNETAAFAAAAHLIGLGHRRIVLLVSTTELHNIRGRVEGFRAALQAHHVPYGEENVVAAGLGPSAGQSAVRSLLERPDRPTAIFAATNRLTLATIQAIRDLGLSIPREISVLGFDDFEWSSALRPYLTTVAQPIREMGDRAWELLTDSMAGESSPRRVRLPCTLIVRESTGRPPSDSQERR